MKRIAAILTFLFSVWVVSAQVGGVNVDLVLDQVQFLPGEDIRVAVRLRNQSGQTLHLSESNNWLAVYVESTESTLIRKFGEPRVVGDITVPSSKIATALVNITPYFNLQQSGGYRITAKVRIGEWDKEVSSTAKKFSIVNGAKLQTIEVGVPSDTKDAPPEVRKYVLQQAEYLKEMKLYLRITDASESKVLKMFPLGRMISFGRPDAQVDRFNNLHVIHQIGKRSFNYCMVNPYGQLMTRQTYDFFGDSRPRLRSLENGHIDIQGGIRHVTDDDLPPEDTLSLSSTPTKPQTDAKPIQP